MHETRRLVEAAAALSLLLRNHGIPHAFYGTIFSAILANNPLSDASIFSISQNLIFNFDFAIPQEIFCIVEGGQNQAHPFRKTRDAVAGNEDFTTTHSPWTNRWVIIPIICLSSSLTLVRLHVTYRRLIPAIEVIPVPFNTHLSVHLTSLQIEILPAGETGPRHLDTSTVMKIQNVPFLTVSEFVRAKLKTWVMYTIFMFHVPLISD